MTSAELYKALYEAFYEAAGALDGNYKSLSMFGHWKKSNKQELAPRAEIQIQTDRQAA